MTKEERNFFTEHNITMFLASQNVTDQFQWMDKKDRSHWLKWDNFAVLAGCALFIPLYYIFKLNYVIVTHFCGFCYLSQALGGLTTVVVTASPLWIYNCQGRPLANFSSNGSGWDLNGTETAC